MNTRIDWYAAGAGLLIAAWHLASMHLHPTVMAGPASTFLAMSRFLTDGGFYIDHLLPSLGRICASVTLGGLVGCGLGVLAGLYREVRWLLEPARFVLTSLPAVVVAILAMLWFGLTSTMVIFTTALLVAPFLYISTVNGIEAIDRRLLDLAHVYRFPAASRCFDVWLPALAPSLLSGLSITVANGLRLSVLSEVLGVNNGVGFLIASSRTNLLTDDLFALVAILFLLVAILDGLVTLPLRRLAGRLDT